MVVVAPVPMQSLPVTMKTTCQLAGGSRLPNRGWAAVVSSSCNIDNSTTHMCVCVVYCACKEDMETKKTKKRKQPSGLQDDTIAMPLMIALPSPKKTSGAFRGKKVTRVSGSAPCTPIKLSNKDHEIDVNHETPSKLKAKFRPKVMANSPTTKATPSLSSGCRRRGDSNVKSSCRRRLDFDSAYIQTKTMFVYTEGGFCFTRNVRKYIADDQQKSLEYNEKEEDECCKKEQELFRQRALCFINSMRLVQGNRAFMGWKGSVVDSVVGVFLTQNTADSYSSSAFMSLAAKYPKENIINNSDNHTEDALDWNAVRCAQADEISNAIQERGMNNRLAARIKMFLDSIHDKNSGLLDLEWLRNAKPGIAMDFFSRVYGLGIKSMECVRLLTLRQRAFPVDRHIARIVVRLGWVPIKKLPDDVLIHQLEEYPIMKSVQEYLSLRLGNLDAETLYELHYQMITFGKVFCTKKKPNCSSCPLKKDCSHFASAYARPEPLEKKIFVPVSSSGQKKNTKNGFEQDIEDHCLGPVIVKTEELMKNAGRSRTEHQVYELPDSHPLVQVLDKRDFDDKNPYLLAIWPPGETLQNPSGMLKEEYNSLKSTDSQEEEMVFGTYLVPCRTATRGSFPLDGTFFQINEVFADDESSRKPLVFPRKLLWGLTKKMLFCGTSISAIFEGLSAQEIQDCFWKGYVCIRGFSMKTRAARPLPEQFHRKGKSPTKRTNDG
ncbi:protein ROS1C isoform X2 [Lactuca sativa]|uniref:protein ROS1C isoform X2 n=1 Tax=Lactuca sativa TaxID=4236 RepID=UPI001C68F2CC|nr:protein ROS1C isoform X2 [Lactuca sativa]